MRILARYESGTATVAVPDSVESLTGRIWDHHGGSWLGHSDVVVMEIGLRAWFVGLQQRWSVRLRACLSLVQLHYDSYYSRHYLMYSDSLQVYNCLVVGV